MTPPDEATRAQIAAADPGASTWLSANAGSGKTRVLTDRVARLLLRGVAPQRILCLTYTKAAATEMQNRLFKRLGAWAMMENAPLQKHLLELGVAPHEIAPENLSRARSLFATAVETPGGLKIQTIHSFCASLLRRFPLEAGVSPAFTEMDERAGKMLRSEIIEQVAQHAPDAMAGFARHFTGAEVDDFLQVLTRTADAFSGPIDIDAVRAVLELSPKDTEDALAQSVFLGSETALLKRVMVELTRFPSSTNSRLLKALTSISEMQTSTARLAASEEAMLTNAGTIPQRGPPTKDVLNALGEADATAYRQLQERLSDARDKRLALAAVEKAKALYTFAQAFLPRLAQAKAQRGWLDFDDLILHARILLSDPRVASWVLFRLDGGIDHVLVDEAQDTSPTQWDVVKLLTKEFTSGEGARPDALRTIFVVGDQKQSIYSFQGADPAQFEDNRTYYSEELDRIGTPLQRQNLRHSFRSSAVILSLVDTCFTPELRAGMGQDVAHTAFKTEMPGRVELWDWIEPQGAKESNWDTNWFDPIDHERPADHVVELAERIAHFIRDRLEHGQLTEVGPEGPRTRAIRPDDFLILVQGRSAVFHAIIRACKSLALPLAGADQLRIGSEVGVKDITALLKYLATPEDNLSFAEVMRSPLGGLSEAELFELCHDRPHRYLRQVFDAHADTYPELHAMLADLRKQADFLRPYELLERLLTRWQGREKLIARLGQEAEEGIAALLELALQYEQSDIPSLTGFLAWLEADEVKIKRQVDSDSGLIRVMTVHGAKGLEAPIVILPETEAKKDRSADAILRVGSVALWKPNKEGQSPALRALNDAFVKRQNEERMRLLYVAMTRAESQLIVCGAGDVPGPDSQAWYNVVEAGMTRMDAARQGDRRVLTHGVQPPDSERRLISAGPERRAKTDLPAWISTPVPTATQQTERLSPSKLGGDKALPGPGALSEEDAKRRGTAIHSLLEHLPTVPRSNWPDVADSLLGDQVILGMPPPLDVADRVLSTPALTHVFAPDGLSEVNLVGTIKSLGHAPAKGTIDRLIVEDDTVLAIDFKSNAVVPDKASNVPDGILRQMGAYLEMLEPIYPNHRIVLQILWTTDASIMTIPHDIVRNALSNTHTS